MFDSEEELVVRFERSLGRSDSPWPAIKYEREFGYIRGRADLVAISGEGTLFAFEAKLDRWRDALHQAYRNLCFAHRSYVVLPRKAAERAARYEAEFARRRVGLCCMDEREIIVMIEAVHSDPLQPWLSHRAARYVIGD